MKIGISGCGAFAECFIPLYKEHPLVDKVVLADIITDRARDAAKRYGINQVVESHDALCQSDVDAIAIYTQRHLHGMQAVQAMQSGKHVYSAVPAAGSMEEIEELVQTVEQTGMQYMSGETSYYYPAAIYCRDKFATGELGEFVYGEGEYMHDMAHGFYEAFQHSGGDDWKRVAGIPPMHYPTHSTSMIISTVGQTLTHVSCYGYRDRHSDEIYGEGRNNWDNPFSNQSALFRTSGGGICRVNEFRRIGHGIGNCVRTSIYGTLGCYEEQGNAQLWTNHAREQEDLADMLHCGNEAGHFDPDLASGQQLDFYSSYAKNHPVHRLPKSFANLPNGHFGSHQFLVDDFVRSVQQNKLAPNHVWASARYLIPGLVAHQSSLKGGEQLPIPDLGSPPEDASLISYDPY
ncbi:MAG: Gfo/Idh/MocA family protein [Puniceicoccaceae bacterium]